MTKTNVPKLRFKGFDGEWSKKKLVEIADRITRKNKNLESNLPLTISAQYGLVDQETFFNKKVASKDLSNYFLVKRGEFAYNKSYSNGYPFGTIKSLKRYDMGVLSSIYIVFSVKENVNHLFMDSFFDSNHWHKEVSTKTTEGARNHGLLNISPMDFMSSAIYIPINMVEQEKIGLFLAKVDNLIELQTKKLELLKKLKRGYLQKMFPQGGESVPILRFSGFNGEWKRTIVKDIGTIVTGNTPSKKDKSNYGGENVWITPSDIGSDYNYLKDSITKLSDKGKSISKTIPKDSVIVTCIASIGKNALSGCELSINQQINALIPNENFNPYFLLSLSSQWSIEMNRLTSNTSLKIINRTEFSKLETLVPEFEEQQEIGKLLNKLDQIINSQSDKIDLLKQQKKAYLQKMFI